MRAVIYPRVSSARQKEAGNIKHQEVDLPKAVERLGWELVRPPDYFSDDGRSAKDGQLDKRLGFARLCAEMKQKPRPFDVVVVADIDRLTRSKRHAERGKILGEFQDAGVLIYEAMSGSSVDLDNPMGDLLAGFKACLAAEENRKRSERTRQGQQRARLAGKKPCGRTPYGYRWTHDGPRETNGWELDPDAAPVVREMFTRVAAGDSLIALARDLHNRGIPTVTAPGKRPGVWHMTRIALIVRNSRLYASGEWVAHKASGDVVRVPPIVSHALASAADEKLAEHGNRNRTRQRQEYLLLGLMVCGICGANMASGYVQPQKDGPIYRYYRCVRRVRPNVNEKRCKAPILKAEEAEARVWSKVLDWFFNVDNLLAALQAEQDTDPHAAMYAKDAAEAKAKLEQFEGRYAKALAAFLAGQIPEHVWQTQQQTNLRTRTALIDQYERARAGADLVRQRQEDTDAVLAAGDRIAERLGALDTLDIAPRREALLMLLSPKKGAPKITAHADGRLEVPLLLSPAAVLAPAPRGAAGKRAAPCAVDLAARR